jgi:hypothetical protein
LIGWGSASIWNHHVVIYGAAIFVAVGICYLLRYPTAARLAAVAVTIVTLIPFTATPAVVALHRVIEVSYGVACAIAYTAAVEQIVRWRLRLRSRATA